MKNRVRLKVCCISSPEEARLAVAHGADASGLVGAMPSGPGVLDDERVREIAAGIPPGVDTFLLTSRDTADDIADHVRFCGTTTVQIVRHIEPEELSRLAAALPSVRRVQVIHVEDASALELIEAYQPHVHAFLLDSGRPNAAVAELGGTGRAHDWNVSAAFVERAQRPVFLAGGLRPENIAEAVARVRPYGVDLCSGVRTNDALDDERLARFVSELWPGTGQPAS